MNITRDPRSAAASTYDLIIVGGGAYGSALAMESARRGLRALLLEQADFGGATTWNSLRFVHGGLRYLQSFDLTRFRESVRERTWHLRTFPELVHPRGCLMPLYGDGLHRPVFLRFALLLNEWLSRGRNDGVRADRAILAGRMLSAKETAERFPLVNRHGLLGGAVWYDGCLPDSQRLIIELLRWASALGASCLNYVKATRLLLDRQKTTGVIGTDAVTGEAYEFRAPQVVNCAGPWCREVAASFDRDVPHLFPFSIAFNVLLARDLRCSYALALRPRVSGAQTYFLHAWKGMTLAGTDHIACHGRRQGCGPRAKDVEDLLRRLNLAMPGFDLAPGDVLRVHWGWQPARRSGSGEVATRPVLFDHGASGGPDGLLSVSGVKHTTARLVAQRVVDQIDARHRQTAPHASMDSRPVPSTWPAVEDFRNLLAHDRTSAAQVVRDICERESVLHLDDLLFRRTEWGMDPRVAKTLGTEIAALMNWDQNRVKEELGRLAEHDRFAGANDDCE